ncbi:Acb2/Tad1 domain-containing protein [Pseudomonas sp. SDO55104_S430]
MDNQHKKITGYRDLTQSEIDGMNSIRALEADTGELFKQISQIECVDPRMLALVKTNQQRGFMWFVRSIAKPADPFD